VSRGRYDAPADRDLWDPPAGPPTARAPGRRRRRLLWLLGVLALAMVLLAVGLFGSVGLTLDGDTMVRDRSYSFRLPGRWWPSPGDRGAVQNAVDFYRGPSTAAGRLHVAVTRERKDITLGELQRLVPFRVTTVAHGRIVKRVSRVRLGGEDAIQLDYQFDSKGTRTYTRQILCAHDGAVYGVMLLVVPYLGSGFGSSADPVAQQILRTWHWGWRWS
jgi:hypothetical protein